MTAFARAAALCADLDSRHASYQVSIIRDALMVSVLVPGEIWEIEFFEDGRVELERFVSQGVNDAPDAHADVLKYFDD